MHVFAFSDKKLLGLTPKRQAKHVALWLRRCYLQILEAESEDFDFTKFKVTYCHINELARCPEFLIPETESQKSWLEFLSNQYHQWLVRADVKLFEKDFLPHVFWGDQLETGPWEPKFDYFVALDQVRSAYNLGSIARTTDALGFAGLITWGITPPLTNKKVKKSSMGSESWIPEKRVESLKEELLALQGQGYQIIALEKAVGAVTLAKVIWPERAVLLLGNEEYGICEELLKVADQMVELPMNGRKNSINVANAFSVVGFTAMMSLQAKLC